MRKNFLKYKFLKDKFLKYQAQTSENPTALEISFAKGSYVYDCQKNAYLGFYSGRFCE